VTFVVGIFCGNSSQVTLRHFFRDFVQESRGLLQHVIQFEESLYAVTLHSSVFDALARTLLKNAE
jgi:hypothetical protein